MTIKPLLQAPIEVSPTARKTLFPVSGTQCCRGIIGDQAAFIENENAVSDGAYLAQDRL